MAGATAGAFSDPLIGLTCDEVAVGEHGLDHGEITGHRGLDEDTAVSEGSAAAQESASSTISARRVTYRTPVVAVPMDVLTKTGRWSHAASSLAVVITSAVRLWEPDLGQRGSGCELVLHSHQGAEGRDGGCHAFVEECCADAESTATCSWVGNSRSNPPDR